MQDLQTVLLPFAAACASGAVMGLARQRKVMITSAELAAVAGLGAEAGLFAWRPGAVAGLGVFASLAYMAPLELLAGVGLIGALIVSKAADFAEGLFAAVLLLLCGVAGLCFGFDAYAVGTVVTGVGLAIILGGERLSRKS